VERKRAAGISATLSTVSHETPRSPDGELFYSLKVDVHTERRKE